MKIVLLILVALVIGIAATLAKKAAKLAKQGKIEKTNPLTEREQAMYFRLTSALSAHIVLAQVAFGAMLKTTDTATRNRFDRKRADFVICTKHFDIVAVIELDDASHRGRATQDRERDALLERAGIKTLRYKNVPDEETVRTDILNTMATAKRAA